jgi:plasmid stabilization system protein ParE
VAEPLFHPEARAEYIAAIQWYEQRSVRAADRFEAEVERLLQRVNDNPELFPKYDQTHRFAVA